jgi:hypothetical protein
MDSSKSKVDKTRPKTGGRVAGTPNKATQTAREAFAQFVDGNAHRFQGWLDEVAQDPKHGAKVALELVLQVSEYYIPKVARTEITGKDGSPLQLEQRLQLVNEITELLADKK